MRNGLVYVDQSAGALKHTVVEGLIDPAQFSVLSSGSLSGLAVRFNAGIIGASHYATVEGSDFAVSEVIACVDVMAPDAPTVICGGIPKCRASLSVPVRNRRGVAVGRYEMRTERGAWNKMIDGAEEVERAARKAMAARYDFSTIGLLEEFPVGEDGRVPMTVLVAGIRRDDRTAISIRTVHSYPNEDEIVLSTTQITLNS